MGPMWKRSCWTRTCAIASVVVSRCWRGRICVRIDLERGYLFANSLRSSVSLGLVRRDQIRVGSIGPRGGSGWGWPRNRKKIQVFFPNVLCCRGVPTLTRLVGPLPTKLRLNQTLTNGDVDRNVLRTVICNSCGLLLWMPPPSYLLPTPFL